MEKIVISLGGNALTDKTGKVEYKLMRKSLQNIIKKLLNFANKYSVVIVPGSGPQIGALVLQNELASKKVNPMPLDDLDARYQGEIGYLMSQIFANEFKRKKISRQVVSVITQVRVDKKDPAFKSPSKPIGPFYSKEKAMQLKKKGFSVFEDSGRGWRRVVASPKPLEIIEIKVIEELLNKNNLVIAAAGGGIPVVRENGKLNGVAAVIDKDLASSCLAQTIKADKLIILTGVDNAYLNFGEKNQKALGKISVKTLKVFLKEGHFGKGSMEPKIGAAIDFVKKSGGVAIITSPKKLSLALNGKAGTIVVP